MARELKTSGYASTELRVVAHLESAHVGNPGTTDSLAFLRRIPCIADSAGEGSTAPQLLRALSLRQLRQVSMAVQARALDETLADARGPMAHLAAEPRSSHPLSSLYSDPTMMI